MEQKQDKMKQEFRLDSKKALKLNDNLVLTVYADQWKNETQNKKFPPKFAFQLLQTKVGHEMTAVDRLKLPLDLDLDHVQKCFIEMIAEAKAIQKQYNATE
jgi:hypothetical protein